MVAKEAYFLILKTNYKQDWLHYWRTFSRPAQPVTVSILHIEQAQVAHLFPSPSTGHLKFAGGPTNFLYSKFHGLSKLIFDTNQYNGVSQHCYGDDNTLRTEGDDTI